MKKKGKKKTNLVSLSTDLGAENWVMEGVLYALFLLRPSVDRARFARVSSERERIQE